MREPGHSQAPRPGRERLPNRRAHELVTFEHDGIGYTAGLGRFEDGRFGEIFLRARLAIEARAAAPQAPTCKADRPAFVSGLPDKFRARRR
jgi:hypothetical protein